MRALALSEPLTKLLPMSLAAPLATPEIQAFASGFPILALHAGLTLALLFGAVGLHAVLSPWKEIDQIRQGNPAASVAVSGVVLGLAVPLAVSLSVSTSAVDVLLWGLVAAIMQLLIFRLLDFVMAGLPQRVRDGEISAGALLAAARLATALILAAALTG